MYRAVLDFHGWDAMGLSVSLSATTTPEAFARVLARRICLPGFDGAAFHDFQRRNVGAFRVDTARLARGVDGGSAMHCSFSAIGFDETRRHAVIGLATDGGGSLLELVRTLDGGWALARSVPLWVN